MTQEQREPHDKAEVGRILHFVVETPTNGIRCRPAIVVEDWPELRQPGLVDLAVFPDGAMDGNYGVDNHRHGSDDNMPEAGKTTRLNYPLSARTETNVRPNHSCRAVGQWHWPRECHILQDPLNPYVDSTGVKVHHNHGLGIGGTFAQLVGGNRTINVQQDLEALLERWPLGALFDLPPLSTVVIIGAYKGITMELIDEIYHPAHIYGFEPQDWAAQEAADRLRDRPHCQVYNVALGINEDKYTMGEWGTDACSLVNTGPESREHGTVQMMPAEIYFKNIPHSDLVVMNIEGYEYTLLSHLRQHGILPTIDRLAIQWHLALQPDGQVTEEVMDRHIDRLYVEDNFFLRYDERPEWTHHTKAMD